MIRIYFSKIHLYDEFKIPLAVVAFEMPILHFSLTFIDFDLVGRGLAVVGFSIYDVLIIDNIRLNQMDRYHDVHFEKTAGYQVLFDFVQK